VEITNLCRDLNCLPRAGGLYDQDAYLVKGIHEVLLAAAEKTNKDMNKSKAPK
jgi:hypothetical protein